MYGLGNMLLDFIANKAILTPFGKMSRHAHGPLEYLWKRATWLK
ncbi:MAG: DUF418 domain-containing protein [Bacteroides intestinalis]|nr:DUF418 domain-containing protein [Bacteroides intestinalis]